jgi:hypothetical protein
MQREIVAMRKEKRRGFKNVMGNLYVSKKIF